MTLTIEPKTEVEAHQIKTFVLLNNLGTVKEDKKFVSLVKEKIKRKLPNQKPIVEKKIINKHI